MHMLNDCNRVNTLVYITLFQLNISIIRILLWHSYYYFFWEICPGNTTHYVFNRRIKIPTDYVYINWKDVQIKNVVNNGNTNVRSQNK